MDYYIYKSVSTYTWILLINKKRQPSDILLILSRALVPVLKGANAASFTIELNLDKSLVPASTSGNNIPISSNSLTRNKEYPHACSKRICNI